MILDTSLPLECFHFVFTFKFSDAHACALGERGESSASLSHWIWSQDAGKPVTLDLVPGYWEAPLLAW